MSPEYLPRGGDTLLIPSGVGVKHLFFALSGSLMLPGRGTVAQAVLVNATSIRAGIPHDAACVLAPGCHPFVQHESYIAYRHLRVDPVTHLCAMMATGVWSPHERCADALLQKILTGLCASKFAAREMKIAFDCPGVIPRA